MEFYKEYRPRDLDEVYGQTAAVAILKKKIETGFPNVVLFLGPSGTGKTSCAKIVAEELKIHRDATVEINCADFRSIDDVRDIRDKLNLSPIAGTRKCWILDEVVQLPATSQKAFLHILENTPPRVFFLLTATEDNNLLPTFLGRCFIINLQPINRKEMKTILKQHAEKLPDKVLDLIIDHANGSARRAWQLFEAALATGSLEEDQIESIHSAVSETECIDLIRAVMQKKDWTTIQGMINSLKGSPETMRQTILRYADSILLDKNSRENHLFAFLVISVFRYDWKECGRPGLTASCWEVLQKFQRDGKG